jgi:hypothetical protein
MANTMTSATVKRYVPKPGTIDLTKRVNQVATDTHPFRKEGEKFSVATALAEHNKLNGWAK